MKKIMVSVGEISGDRNLSHVISRLKKRDSTLDFCGLVGPELKKLKVRPWADITQLSSIGFLEPLRHIFRYFSLYALIKKRLREEKPDLVLCVDSQGLNMIILKMARELGIKTLYYISPMEWHWGTDEGGRKVIAKADRILSIIQKEDRFYKRLGGDVTYVGHPLVDTCFSKISTEAFREQYKLSKEDQILAVFPGSRKQELKLIYPLLLGAAKKIHLAKPKLKIFVSVVEDYYRDKIKEGLREFGLENLVILYKGPSCDLIAQSYLSLVTSGTISLEHAIMEKPCVVAYKVSGPSYFFIKTFFKRIFEKVPYVSLVNEFFKKAIFPECLQDKATPEKIAEEAFRFLDDKDYYNEVCLELKKVRDYLGEPGTLDRTANQVYNFLKERTES